MIYSRIADNFKYERNINLFELINGVKSTKSNETYPYKTPSFRMGFHAVFRVKEYSYEYIAPSGNNFDGLLIFIHKNEELLMKSSKQFYNRINETTSFLITPQQKVLDEDLYELNVQE